MNEASVSEYTRNRLKERGFFVQKYNDSSTTGVLDMFIAKDGKAMWVEDKFISVQTSIGGLIEADELRVIKIPARSFVSPDRMVQLVNAVRLAKEFPTEYWLYVEHKGKLYVARLYPKDVWNSYRIADAFKQDGGRMTIALIPAKELRDNFEL